MLTIYTSPRCHHCTNVKEYLQELDISYKEVDISADQASKDWILEQGHRTVPQIYQGNTLVVEDGATSLLRLTKAQIEDIIDNI